MSLRVVLHSTDSKLPVEQPDGSYEIYSAETKKIHSGISSSVCTEITIAIPVGFHVIIKSCELAAKFNIETSTYSSMSDKEYRLSSGESQPVPLVLYLRNFGKTHHLVKAGDVIARMVIVRNRILPVVEVQDITQADQNTKIVVMQPKIKALPKAPMSWFKNMYKENPTEVGEKYCSLEILASVEEYKKSEVYLVAKNKSTVEANYVWRLLGKDARAQISKDFAIVKSAGSVSDEEPSMGRTIARKAKKVKKPEKPKLVTKLKKKSDDINDLYYSDESEEESD